MNTNQRNELVRLLGETRMAGGLADCLVTLHENLCLEQREALEAVCRIEADIARMNEAALVPQEGGAFELHLGAGVELTATVRRTIKDMGGSYSECRGHSETRFVTIPNTAAGRELTAKLAMAHVERARGWKNDKVTVIVRAIMGRAGGTDHVFYGNDWTVEKLSNCARNVNARGIRAALADRRRDLEQARGRM